MKLLSVGTNAKTLKSDNSGKGWLTAILYLSPAKTSGRQVCPNSSQGCRDSCLFTAGRGAMSNVQTARTRKTNLFFNDRKTFLELLHIDLNQHEIQSTIKGLDPCVRLNGTSDIPWEKIDPTIFSQHQGVQFYEYTKIRQRMRHYMDGKLPDNLHLTFSRSEHNWGFCKEVLERKFNVSVVFGNTPKVYRGYSVFSGDDTDLRFLDKKGIVGLKAKGKAKKDQTGFVVWTP